MLYCKLIFKQESVAAGAVDSTFTGVRVSALKRHAAFLIYYKVIGYEKKLIINI